MHELAKEGTNLISNKRYRSLSHHLVRWFLLLSLIPLMLTAWLGYRQTVDGLTTAVIQELEQDALKSARFIQNWFDYRLMDLNTQSENRHNAELLMALRAGLLASGKGTAEFVNSYGWARLVDGHEQDIKSFMRHYDYIYDLMLIDIDGNLLYSVERGPDLGTNLFNGPYAASRFARSASNSLKSGEALFSDLERYAPSDGQLTGFFTAPVLDGNGDKIGLFAIQVRLERINALMLKYAGESSLSHYLVGEDGLLRTPLNSVQAADVLVKRLDTEPFKFWQHEQHDHDGHEHDAEYVRKMASYYPGPAGQQVIGVHQTVVLPGANWLLISEIDQDEALASAHRLGVITLVMFLLTGTLVTLAAIYQARRITRPITQLVDASMKVAAGEIEHQVEVDASNEIGQLAEAFNHMLQMRQVHEQALQQTTAQAQHALVDLAEQKFALDQHAIVAITDLQGTITFVNEKFSEVSGYGRDELIGQNHRLLNSGYHNREFFQEIYQTIGNGEVWHGEICNRAKDGHLYWVDSTIVPFKGDDGKPQSYIAIRTDITERKRVEEALIEAKNSAEYAARAKSEFLASMSHEIRTPMNGVLGMLGLLLNTQLNADQRHRATLAQSSAKSLLSLINDILDFSKVEAGKLELEMLDFNLRSMLGDFAEAMALQAHGKGLELVLDMTGVEYSMVKGDPGRLRQVLTNLVSNSIKFTSQGEIVISVALHAQDNRQLCMVCTVTDTGIGIPVDKLNQLFDSFSQVDASTTRKYGGTGLGLAISKKLSELMGGDITVSSEPGRGSSFEVSVLLEQSEHSQQVVPQVDMQALNLLMVDDNATNREVLRAQLEHWGATVVEAQDGVEALAVCAERSAQTDTPFFDIAFLDMQMPDMDGAELGKLLKADPRFSAMKLVMMTSMGHQGDVQRFADLGFSAYFPKPATTSDLFDALSVVAEDGVALQQASPLVTHNYLETLAHNREREAPTFNREDWPANTRLLLVEDNQMNQLVATGILNELGLQADVAANGVEALKSLQQAPRDALYTLVIMDCQMPEMDGYQASREIRAGHAGEHNKSVPIIAMTANAMQGDREKCLDAGMSDYLAKPIEPDQLLSKLQQWLAGTESLQGNQKHNDSVAESSTEQPLVWDREAALRRILGKEDLLYTLIDVVLQETPIRVTELQQAIEAGDSKQVGHLAHSIKGVAANLSGLRLQQQAGLIEAAAKEGDMSRISGLMPALQQASEQLKVVLEQYKESCNRSSQRALLSKEDLVGYLQNCSNKLEHSDYLAPDEIAPLRKASSNPAVQKLLDQLLEQIECFDYKAAMDTLKTVVATAGVNLDQDVGGTVK